jgi:hypothetical protein
LHRIIADRDPKLNEKQMPHAAASQSLVAIPAIIAAGALVLLGATQSPFYSVTLLSFLAAGVHSCFGPFSALPSEFLTGFSAAAGIALINSVGNLGGFAGPYMIGIIPTRTGSLYAGLAMAGVVLFISGIAIADFNGDGKLDVVASSGDGTLTVLLGNTLSRSPSKRCCRAAPTPKDMQDVPSSHFIVLSSIP